MKKLLIIALTIVSLSGCDPECTSSASCVAPPDGVFESKAINIAVSENILEEFEPSSFRSVGELDSMIVNSSTEKLKILDFYQWIALGNESTITSIDIYYEEKPDNLTVDDFLFENTESSFTTGGYLLTIIKSDEKVQLQILRASQDLVDGVCNDTFDC